LGNIDHIISMISIKRFSITMGKAGNNKLSPEQAEQCDKYTRMISALKECRSNLINHQEEEEEEAETTDEDEDMESESEDVGCNY
jgi:hypothetical protein